MHYFALLLNQKLPPHPFSILPCYGVKICRASLVYFLVIDISSRQNFALLLKLPFHTYIIVICWYTITVNRMLPHYFALLFNKKNGFPIPNSLYSIVIYLVVLTPLPYINLPRCCAPIPTFYLPRVPIPQIIFARFCALPSLQYICLVVSPLRTFYLPHFSAPITTLYLPRYVPHHPTLYLPRFPHPYIIFASFSPSLH